MRKKSKNINSVNHPEFGEYINKISRLLDIVFQNYTSGGVNPKFILDESEATYPSFTEEMMEVAYHDNSIRLDAATKDQFEHLFNSDFSHVRIHTGKYAEELTRNAKAFAVTIGDDIYFAQGYYAPDTEAGMKLLAHELQHVVQNIRGDRHVYREDISRAEHEADKIEDMMTPTLLFDMPSLDKSPSLDLAPTPFPYPNTGGSDKAALKKSAGGEGTGGVEDFAKRKEKTYSIVLQDGSKARLSQKDLAGVSRKFKEMVQDWMEDERMIRSEDEYQQNIIKFFG